MCLLNETSNQGKKRKGNEEQFHHRRGLSAAPLPAAEYQVEEAEGVNRGQERRDESEGQQSSEERIGMRRHPPQHSVFAEKAAGRRDPGQTERSREKARKC